MSICGGVAGYVSIGGVTGGLLLLLVWKHADVAAFNPLNNYFVSGFFKTSSVYYMYHGTFSNYFIISSF